MQHQYTTSTNSGMPSLPRGANPEGGETAYMTITKEEPNDGGGEKNENSVMSFWSSSNSDSDDFNDHNKIEAADVPSRRGKKGHGRSSRRRRSPGSNNAHSGSENERKEYENRGATRRSRSRDNSPEKKQEGYADSGMGGGPTAEQENDAQNTGNHHRRERSNGSPGSKGSSQERGGRNDSRRKSQNSRKDIGTMGSGNNNSNNLRGALGANLRKGGNPKRDGGEYNQKGFFFPSMSKPLVSFQQFSSLQTRQSDVWAIKTQYKYYSQMHRDKHSEAFYKEHEKEPWFMEQYNPMTVYQIKVDQQALIKAKASAFFSKMPFDLLDLTKRDDYGALDGPQFHKFDPNSRTLYLKQIPVFVARVQLKEAVSSVTTGLEQIIFSKPLQMHNFERFAWLVFFTQEQADTALIDLETLVIRSPQENQSDDFKLSPIKNNQTVKMPKVTPEMALDHVSRDIGLCKRLIKEVFDAEKEIEFPFNKLETDVESQDAKLDTLVLYLRQVHGYCFFCGVKCEDERTLAGKCASQHLRLPPSIDRLIFDTSALYGSAKQFEQNYVTQAEKFLEKGQTEKLSDPQEDELLVEMKNQYCIDKCREVVEGKKYVCMVCEKAFRTTDFVVKHVKNKHDDRLVARFNYSYFKNQARDNFVTELKKMQDSNPTPFYSQNQTGSNLDTQFDSNRGSNDRGRFNRQFNSGDDFQHRGSFRGGRGDFRGGRGGRGGHSFVDRNYSGDTGMMGGSDGGLGGLDIDGERRKVVQAQREYVDYDDPTQFDREGQRITGQQTAQLQHQQHQLHQQQQQMLLSKSSINQGIGSGASGAQNHNDADRQLVSYDDLF